MNDVVKRNASQLRLEIRANRERLEALRAEIAMDMQSLVDLVAEFKAGDTVCYPSKPDKRFRIEKSYISEDLNTVNYFGRLVKKDGSLGVHSRYLYQYAEKLVKAES